MAFIVKSKVNPKLILCENGDFISEDFVGPCHKNSAKIHKRKCAAQKVMNGEVIVEPYKA